MIHVNAKNEDGYIISELTQWDRGVTVYIEHPLITEAHAVHFASRGDSTALVVEGEYADGALSAKIPDSLLTIAKMIYGYVYVEDGDFGQSIIEFNIRVHSRAEPSDVVYCSESDYITVKSALEDLETQLAKVLALLEDITATDEDVAEMIDETFNDDTEESTEE